MIPESQKITIERENVGRESFFKLDAGSSHLMKILRSGIYSRKELAVCREYSVNALEAHMMNGKQETPIEVTLPGLLDPMWKVRDFGPGLSFAQIKNLICSYGSTTKDESNEFIGCFGIGSKAGFSYSNTFQIISWHNGKKSIYNCYIDETEIGKITELSTEKSDEASGIEIGIPVNQGDISTFIKECRNLYRFWRVPPIIKGNSEYSPIVNEYYLQGQSGSWAFVEKEDYYDTSFLVMGGVPYRISASNITGLDDFHSKMLSSSLVLFANIGDVTVASSREEVSYTPKTISWIKSALRAVEAEAKGEIDSKFAACTTEYQVRELYYQIFGGGILSNVMHRTLFNDYSVEFNGRKITNYKFDLSKDTKFRAIHSYCWEKTRRGYIYRFKNYDNDSQIDFFTKEKSDNAPATGRMFYYIGDIDTTLAKKLMKFYLTELNPTLQKVEYYVINFATDQDRIDWFNETGVPETLFNELTSSITIPPKARKPRAARQSNPKTNCVVYDDNGVISGKSCEYHYDNRDWRYYDVDVKNTSGFYVIKHYSHLYLDSKAVADATYHDQSRVDNCITMLHEISDEFQANPVCYAFNESDIKKLDPNHWTPLASLVKTTLQVQHDKFDTAKIPIGNTAYGAENVFYCLYKGGFLSFTDDNPVKELIVNFEMGGVTPIKRYEELCNYFRIEMKAYDDAKIAKLKKLVAKELKKYPLLGNVSSVYEDMLEELAIYMRAKDLKLSEKISQKVLDSDFVTF